MTRPALPRTHLILMNLVLACDLLDRLIARQRFQRNSGLELRREPASLGHLVSLRYPENTP